MYNGEELTTIVIENADGEIIAKLNADSLTCNNNKFSIRGGHFEDQLIIRLEQKTYK